MIKAGIRDLIGGFAAASGTLSRRETAIHGHLTILCYHRVLPAKERSAYHDADLVVEPEMFALQCQVLREHYEVLPLVEALAAFGTGRFREKPLAAITFDDGYRDNVAFAEPILRKHGLRATFFVVVGLVDSLELPWYDTAAAAWLALNPGSGRNTVKAEIARAKLMSPSERQLWIAELTNRADLPDVGDLDHMMTSEQLRALAAAGHEIGSHTLTHPLLPQCDDGALARELGESRRRLATILDRSVPGFCYPNGDSDDRVRQATQAVGYDYAASGKSGTNEPAATDRMALKRWFVSQDRLSDRSGQPSKNLLRMEVSGLADRILWRRRL